MILLSFVDSPKGQIDWLSMSPFLIVAFGALLLMLVDMLSCAKKVVLLEDSAFEDKPKGGAEVCSALLTILVLLLALFFVLPSSSDALSSKIGGVMSGEFSDNIPTIWHSDILSSVGSFLILFCSVVVTAFGLRHFSSFGVNKFNEAFALALFAVSGALVLVCANDLFLAFVGLELLSIPIYVLCGARIEGIKGDRSVVTSSESSVKYFILGAFSSALTLLGMAFVFGACGTVSISEIQSVSGTSNPDLLGIGLAFLLAGLFFKIAAVPFHFWAPDVYQGAPLPVVALMAVVVKIAAFVFLARILFLTFSIQAALWLPALWIVAIVSMTLGNLLALRQNSSLKRLFACSTIAQSGYLLLIFVADASVGIPAMLFYLIVYSISTCLFFASLHYLHLSNVKQDVRQQLLTTDSNREDHPDNLDALMGRQPFLAIAFAIAVLGFIGLPPALAGLTAKVVVLKAAYQAGFGGTVVFALLCVAFSCAYYLPLIFRLFKKQQVDEADVAKSENQRLGIDGTAYYVISLLVVLLAILSIFPDSILKALYVL